MGTSAKFDLINLIRGEKKPDYIYIYHKNLVSFLCSTHHTSLEDSRLLGMVLINYPCLMVGLSR